MIGLINHGGMPKVLTLPGRYPGFPIRNWWAREWCGAKGRTSTALLPRLESRKLILCTVSDTVVEFHGLTIVQVSQNQAAVISDPQNHIFVIKNAGLLW